MNRYFFYLHLIGFIIGSGIILLKSNRFKIRKRISFYLTIIFGVIFVISAKIVSIIRNLDYYSLYPKEIFLLSGFGFYGGFIPALIFIFIICRIKKINFSNYADLSSYGIAIAEGFGRIGCYLTGCCYGKPSELPWAIIPDKTQPAFFHFGETHIHPTQLYYSLFCFFLFFYLFFIKQKFKGFIFLNYLIFHSLMRLIIDPLRADVPYFLFNLPISWFLSLILLIIGIVGIIIKKR